MKNLDYICNKVAKEKNLDPKLVKKIANFYWYDGVFRTMFNMEHDGVWIKGVGTFTISYYLIKKEIYKTIRQIRKIRYRKNSHLKPKTKTELEYMEYLRKLWIRKSAVAEGHFHTISLSTKRKNERLLKINSENTTELRQDNGGDCQSC